MGKKTRRKRRKGRKPATTAWQGVAPKPPVAVGTLDLSTVRTRFQQLKRKVSHGEGV